MTVEDDVVDATSGASAAEAAYRALFDAHFTGLVRLAALLGSDDPDDVTQEAFVRLYHHRSLLRDPDAALPYLRRTIANLCTSRLRHLRTVARQRRSGEPPQEVPSAEHTAIARETHRRLIKAVAGLRPRQRRVVVLRYWLDLPLDEIARTLGLPPGSVKSALHRARAALALAMEEAE